MDGRTGLKYGSICSGIEAASLAWHASDIGWQPVFFSEVAKFPRSVLSHRFPGVPLHGDFTTIKKGDYDDIDLLVGGTPCQSFSNAGLRRGLDDERGNLALEYCRLVDRLRPQWLVWENVAGVLSSNKGRDFAALIGALDELRYHLAWRVLDARYWGVPQRRRRVFLVGHTANGAGPAAVLFERESMCRDTPPRRGPKKEIAGTLTSRAGNGSRQAGANGNLVAVPRSEAFGGNRTSGALDVSTTLTSSPSSSGRLDFASETFIVEPAIAFDCKAGGRTGFSIGDLAGTLRGDGHGGGHSAVCNEDVVRRFTPTECQRLQGMPDGWTDIPIRHYDRRTVTKRRPADRWREDPAGGWWLMAEDGPRYKAIGNSMAVPVMRWIGKRIATWERIQADFSGSVSSVP